MLISIINHTYSQVRSLHVLLQYVMTRAGPPQQNSMLLPMKNCSSLNEIVMKWGYFMCLIPVQSSHERSKSITELWLAQLQTCSEQTCAYWCQILLTALKLTSIGTFFNAIEAIELEHLWKVNIEKLLVLKFLQVKHWHLPS